jgi:hypothetical protein
MRRSWAAVVVGGFALASCSIGGSGNHVEATAARGEISKLMAKAAHARYRVTYARTGAGTTTIVIGQDPPEYFIAAGDTSAYRSSGGSFTKCERLAGVISCQRLPAAAALLEEVLILGPVFGATGALFVYDGPNGIDGLTSITPVSKTIAGRAARCVTFSGAKLAALDPSGKGAFTACIDGQSGVLLESRYVDGTGQTVDVVATKYGEPVAADFTPPVNRRATTTTS